MNKLNSDSYLLQTDRQILLEFKNFFKEYNIDNFDKLIEILDKNNLRTFADIWNYCSSARCNNKLAEQFELFIKRIKSLNRGKIENFLSSSQVGYYLADKLCGQNQEQLYGIYLDSKNRIIAEKLIFQGTLNKAVVHPRDIFRWAIVYNAAAFFIVHNHPSGDTTPSKQDLSITNKIKQASEYMGIQFLDHFIVSDETYLSFREEKLF